jgi:hypothetical protein
LAIPPPTKVNHLSAPFPNTILTFFPPTKVNHLSAPHAAGRNTGSRIQADKFKELADKDSMRDRSRHPRHLHHTDTRRARRRPPARAVVNDAGFTKSQVISQVWAAALIFKIPERAPV